MGARVTQIPGIMRANGLHTGARVMDRWFSLNAHSNPETNTPQFDLITMEFVRGFSGPRQAIDDAIAARRWNTPNARTEIVRTLNRRGKLSRTGTHRFFFDNINGRNPDRLPAADWRAVDADHVQILTVGSQTGPITDFKAALGRAVIRFLVAGSVTVTDTSASITVERVGLYVRDAFDFNDDNDWFSQPLGYWEAHTNYVGRAPMLPTCEVQYSSVNILDGIDGMPRGLSAGVVAYPTGVSCYSSSYITNADFRAWRASSGRGGDFLLFSNIEAHTTSDSFTVAKPVAGWGTV